MGACEQRFIFRGNAVGAAGHIHQPQDLIIWVQGASTLPVIGGYSRSSVERANFSDVLSFDSIRTQATGDLSAKENAYKTLANSVVKGVNVSGRLTADALEATLTSTHPVSGAEPTIVPTGTQITNLRLDGYPVNVKLDIDMFTQYGTHSSLAHAYAGDDAFFKKYGNRFCTSPSAKPKGSPDKRQIPEAGGYIVCSIVSEIQTSHPRATVDGHVITLNGFGRIYLGELLINSVSRRLTLLRVKLGSTIDGAKLAFPVEGGSQGSPVDGDVSCAGVESNGSVIF